MLLRACWRAQARKHLAPVEAALNMGPKERALYLKQSVGSMAANLEEEEAATLAGVTPSALRSWLRQARSHLPPMHSLAALYR